MKHARILSHMHAHTRTCVCAHTHTHNCPGMSEGTCHDQAVLIFQHLSEEAGDDHLWTDHESDLLLHTSMAQHTTAKVLVGKVHLHACMHPSDAEANTIENSSLYQSWAQGTATSFGLYFGLVHLNSMCNNWNVRLLSS